jgi:hypothetical protein
MLPTLDEPLVVGRLEEQNVAGPGAEAPPAEDDVLAVDVVPVPRAALLPAVPPAPCLELCAPPVAEPPDDCADDPDEPIVSAGTSSGSVPQDEEVVTPPVALSETEHGIPKRLRAGLVWRARWDEPVPEVGVPGVAADADGSAGVALPGMTPGTCA